MTENTGLSARLHGFVMWPFRVLCGITTGHDYRLAGVEKLPPERMLVATRGTKKYYGEFVGLRVNKQCRKCGKTQLFR